MKIFKVKIGQLLFLALFIILCCDSAYSQLRRSPKSYVQGGMLIPADTTKVDSLRLDSLAVDSLAMDSLALDSLMRADSLFRPAQDRSDSLFLASAAAARAQDTLATPMALKSASPLHHSAATEEKQRQPFFSDSMSLSKMCWIAAALPGYGQIYNKQYWKLPILYGALGTGIALYVNENKTYKPLKEEYDNLILNSATTRTEELNAVQSAMIKSNTRRQIYMGATIASYIFFLGDAAINYSTNEVSDIKKATTLSMICPGAGQIYNKSYWRVPIVIGGLASMVYVYDWNNRGYQRFKTAYTLVSDYENNPDDYPNGSLDEFGGAYSASYMQSLRDSYRRNRDYSVIIGAAVYLFQVLDAHVDAHLKDFDISDDLTLNVQPTVNYSNSLWGYNNSASYGLNLNFRF
ncbi:MAG: DUF5683 domain-containing protein [Rikenellaceae bacterium]